MSRLPVRLEISFRLFVVLLFAWCHSPAGLAEQPQPPATVALIIDYNDGVQKHFPKLAWRPGMTVLDAMQAAQAHPRGIRFAHRGAGATALLYQIDDLENQANGRNWLYRINGKLATRGFGVQKVQAGDAVLWRHEKFK